MSQTTTVSSNRQAVPGTSIEYRLLYSLVFAACFCIAALFRLLPRRMHPWSSNAARGSLWQEARRAADSSVPYVFQV